MRLDGDQLGLTPRPTRDHHPYDPAKEAPQQCSARRHNWG